MALVVHKYGGTSVGSIEKIKKIARKIIESKKRKENVVAVVSAMAGETDRLLGLANSITDIPEQRELDLLLSSGERVSAALLAMAIRAKGYDCVSFTGRQVGILTDAAHSRARIKKIHNEKVKNALNEGKIPIVAGFQGINEHGDVTTLGRGGSDLTAVALAHAIGADQCLIFKDDVDGVYTSDPSVVENARKIPRLAYEEMLEMAGLGAKVLHSRAVEMAAKYNVPIRVLSTFGKGEGTLVTKEDATMEKELVSAVIGDKNQAKVTIAGVPDRPGIAAEIFERLAEKNLNVDMIIQNVGEAKKTDISFTVPKPDVKIASKVTEVIAKNISADHIQVDPDIAKISIVGVGMKSHSGVAARMFKALSDAKINIMMISTSEIKISCVINKKHVKEATNILHDTFNLGKRRSPYLG